VKAITELSHVNLKLPWTTTLWQLYNNNRKQQRLQDHKQLLLQEERLQQLPPLRLLFRLLLLLLLPLENDNPQRLARVLLVVDEHLPKLPLGVRGHRPKRHLSAQENTPRLDWRRRPEKLSLFPKPERQHLPPLVLQNQEPNPKRKAKYNQSIVANN